ncbi:MAG: SRPBCC domain-containing protein [Balneolaceae bacterium]|nr:SRPBCC domain-containing protein [Balneolaceae bacterium]
MVHIRHNLIIDAPPENVYKAITTKGGIQNWWTDDTEIEPIIGSIATFNFGDRYHNEMKIVDIQPNKRVEWLCIEADAEWIDTTIIFEIEEKDRKAFLRFAHNNWKNQNDFYAHCNYQWGRYMNSLKCYCETGKGNPFIQ